MEIVVLKDNRESPKKCSLTPLQGTPGIQFHPCHGDQPFDAQGMVLLHHEGDPLTPADRGAPLLLIDSSWRRLEKILPRVTGQPARRSIPGGFSSAYPRKSKSYADPQQGLASVEALYVASVVLGEPWPDLLANYYWRESFLKQNQDRFQQVAP